MFQPGLISHKILEHVGTISSVKRGYVKSKFHTRGFEVALFWSLLAVPDLRASPVRLMKISNGFPLKSNEKGCNNNKRKRNTKGIPKNVIRTKGTGANQAFCDISWLKGFPG